MSEDAAKKQNNPTYLKDLILLFAVPIAIAIFVAGIVYIPRLLANPKSDFIYSLCSDYDCIDSFEVNSSKQVTRQESRTFATELRHKNATLRYYDSENDSTKSVSLEEARQYRLNTSSKSSDGYTLTREQGEGGFLFWGDYSSGWYLKNGAKKKQVDLEGASSDYSQDIKFLGWVEK